MIELLSFCLFVGVLIGAVLFCFVLIVARRVIPFLRPKKPDFLSNKYVSRIIIALALVEIICFDYGYFIEPNWIAITHLELHSGKIPHGKNIRIVQLSDLHIEAEGSRELRTPELANQQNPDLIILTGDYLNTNKGRHYLSNFLGKLRAKSGIYAVPGNFDTIYKSDDIFQQHGIMLGYNDVIPLKINDCKITLYLNSSTNQILDPQSYNICVHHKPDEMPDAASFGYDLYLCGHTHGGQVRLPFYGAVITLSKYGKRYEMGYYREGQMDAYVNRGIGMEGGIIPRVRFLARPEIAVIDIRSKDTK